MSLEAKIDALIAAVEANTAALKGAKGGTTTTGDKGTTTTTGKTKAVTPKNNIEQVKAAAVKIKDKFGTPVAKELIKEAGKADELAKVEPANYDAFVKACEEKLAEADGGGDDEGSGL